MAGRKKLKKYKMAVGICGPTVLYTNIIKAYSAEEAAKLYLDENNDAGKEITDEMVSEIAKKMFEIEEAKALDAHYDACGERLVVGNRILCAVKMQIVEGTIVKLTNRGVKVSLDNSDFSISIGQNDYKEIDGENLPFFAKIVKLNDNMASNADVEIGSFVAYMDIRFGTCMGFGFGTVTRITPSYVYIDTGNDEIIRKSADKVRRLR